MTVYKRSQITLFLGAALWFMAAAQDCKATFCNNDPVNQVDELGLAGYFFDGTWINKDDPENPVESNVARLIDGYQSKVVYREGVGSTGNWLSRLLGGVGGAGWDERLKWMYDKLVKIYNDDRDPENKKIDIFGFSRGAGMARDFANMIRQLGINYKGRRIVPEIRFIGVFDTVASKGIPGNDINSGSELSLPDNVKAVAHPMSKHDVRGAFPLTRFRKDPRVKEVWVAGVHADGGGAYPTARAQGYIPLYFTYLEAWKAGVPLGDFPEQYYQAINRYRARHNLGWDELWSEDPDDIKVGPYHDSTDAVQYYPDKVKRGIRSAIGLNPYKRKIYVH